MTEGEIVLIVVVGLVALGFFFICLNNIRFQNKQEQIAKEKKAKDVQPVADVSPKQVNIEKDLKEGVPLDVNDPIFTKKGYENITERTDLKTLIEEEKQKDNFEILSKMNHVEITSEPIVVDDEYDDMVTKVNDISNLEQEMTMSSEELEAKYESHVEEKPVEEPKKESGTIEIMRYLSEDSDTDKNSK